MPFTKGSRKSCGDKTFLTEPGPSKGDKCSSDEDDESVPRKGKAYSNSKSKQGKMSKKSPNVSSKQASHSSGHNKTAELFRKDLISAMKMADTEILHESDYLVIADQWRQEWEKGVQVPVNEDELLPIEIREVNTKPKNGDFKLHPRKFLHDKNDETYQSSQHQLTNMQDLAESIVRYDLDDQDVTWLQLVNEDREEMDLQLINEWNMERMIEELENQCYVKTNALKKTEEGLGIEYDEDVACDVCRMLESEDTNEMVFCDGCDICVHQACYGIQTIPEGSWLCRICALGIKPMCLLCPKRGGAMKSTKSGTKWTHVSCALWIPEVSIGCPEKMEPITKISNIPPSRWALVCCLCKERVGACIQCSVKQCKTAFHVTCGFAHNLDMKTIVDESDDIDGIHLRAYCPKHTKNKNAVDCESPKKEDCQENEHDISEAEMARKRLEKLKQLEEDFFTLIDIEEISTKFFIPEEAVDVVAAYWKLKRKANNNKPLITPKMEEEDQMQKQQQDSLSARMKMFVHLRQDLERARNLCYMISKREKNKRQLFKLKESVFLAQISVLTDPELNLSAKEAEKVRLEYSFDSVYSDYGVASARTSRQPRENLFTLENLKTPKDYEETDDEGRKRSGKVSKPLPAAMSGKSKDSNLAGGKVPHTTGGSRCRSGKRENLFFGDSFKKFSDSTAESSEDEFLSSLAKSTQAAKMSRLGKVKLKEIEDCKPDGGAGDIITVPQPPLQKFIPSSDLRKKLTSILQTKNMMHQRHEKVSSVLPETVTRALHVDINSDSDVFTSDTNTDLTSPIEQPRNLFDRFSVQGKPILSSPDLSKSTIKSSFAQSKYKTKKHSKRKHKSKLLASPDYVGLSSSQLQGDFEGQNAGPTQDDADHGTSSLSPAFRGESPSSDYQKYSNSLSQSGKGKKRKHRDLTPDSVSQPLHSLEKSLPHLSPSPRVNPHHPYSAIDGDIYVPSGKIQVTERTIVLNDPQEVERPRPRSKLRLKKQANSPVKGIASYEVVQEEEPKHNVFLETKPSLADDQRNIFDSVLETRSHSEISDRRHVSGLLNVGPRGLRKNKKTLEESYATISQPVVLEPSPLLKSEQCDVTESHGLLAATEAPNLGRHTRKSQAAVKPVEDEACMTLLSDCDMKKDILDENLRPVHEPSANLLTLQTRSHSLRSVPPVNSKQVTTEGQERPASRKQSASHRLHSAICGHKDVMLQPLPTKPHLKALHDRKQLIVKEDLKKRVAAKMIMRGNGRGRWKGVNGTKDPNQMTIDRYTKRTNSCENVFSKPDVVVRSSAQRLSLSLANPPLRVHKSSSINTSDEAEEVSGKPGSLELFPAKATPVFGAHALPKSRMDNYRIPRKQSHLCGNQNTTPPKTAETDESTDEALFGDVDKLGSPRLKEHLSFEDVSKNSEYVEVVRTPPKCNSAGLNDEGLDGVGRYRSRSSPSSEGSEASSRDQLLNPHEGVTPGRAAHRQHHTENSQMTPSKEANHQHLTEDSQSPGTRSRTRESLLKAPQFKLS